MITEQDIKDAFFSIKGKEPSNRKIKKIRSCIEAIYWYSPSDAYELSPGRTLMDTCAEKVIEEHGNGVVLKTAIACVKSEMARRGKVA